MEDDITVDSTFIRFSCEAVEDSLSIVLAEDCEVVAVGRLDVDMELPAFTISWGTAAAIATAPWNTLYLKKKKKKSVKSYTILFNSNNKIHCTDSELRLEWCLLVLSIVSSFWVDLDVSDEVLSTESFLEPAAEDEDDLP